MDLGLDVRAHHEAGLVAFGGVEIKGAHGSSLREWLTFYSTRPGGDWHAGPMQPPRVDVAIVGGGPAGLSAALMLGRCRRQVVVIDAGEQRNRKAQAIHGYLTRDGASPTDILRLAEMELLRYPTVRLQS